MTASKISTIRQLWLRSWLSLLLAAVGRRLSLGTYLHSEPFLQLNSHPSNQICAEMLPACGDLRRYNI